MEEYLKLWNNHEEYEEYAKDEKRFIRPNVSYCIAENECHYTDEPKDDFATKYLTFVPQEDITFSFSGNDIEYSTDGGNTWSTLQNENESETIANGTEVMFRGRLTPKLSGGIGTFIVSGNFSAEGNPMSLLYGSDFIGVDTLSGKPYAFRVLFNGCTGMTDAENLSLPALTLSNACYYGMFSACTSLDSIPRLPAEVMAPSAYTYMFMDCTSIDSPVELPAHTLANACYYGMFEGCTKLAYPPELPAVTMEPNCYRAMFHKCSSLEYAPSLPSRSLSNNCYRYMFNLCTSITKSPSLEAETLASGCYNNMFNGCKSLNEISMFASDLGDGTALVAWAVGVARIGTFHKNARLPEETIGRGGSGIPNNWTVVDRGLKSLCIEATSDLTVSFTNSFRYSYGDKKEWYNYTANSILYVGEDETIFMEADLTPSQNGIGQFTINGDFTLIGDVTSLVGYKSITGLNNVFSGLFKGCTGLTDISKVYLPGETSEGCYQAMFSGCSSLEYVMPLSSQTLSEHCYELMFAGCTSLFEIPELNAETLAPCCYKEMFKGCTRITKCILPASTLSSRCYEGMFSGCSSLNDIKALFTTTPSDSYTLDWVYGVAEYGVFEKSEEASWTDVGTNAVPLGWKAINGNIGRYLTTRALEAGTITITIGSAITTSNMEAVAYSTDLGNTWSSAVNVNSQAVSLTTPVLSEGDEVIWKGVGQQMAIASVEYSKNPDNATKFSSTCNYLVFGNSMSMLYGDNFADKTTFPTNNYSMCSLFYGNTKLTSAEHLELPSMTIVENCYNDMFNGCSILTASPTLPATSLAPSSYKRMFKGCIILSKITMLALEITPTQCIDNWVSGVGSVGTFYKNKDATWSKSGASGVPSKWTIIPV